MAAQKKRTKRQGLSVKQELALQVISDRPYSTKERICAEVGIGRKTLWEWEQDRRFAAEVARRREEWAQDLREERLASKRERFRTLRASLERLEATTDAVYASGKYSDVAAVEGRIAAIISIAGGEAPDEQAGLTEPQDSPAVAITAGEWMQRYAQFLADSGRVTVPAEEITAYQMAELLIEFGRKADAHHA